MPLVRARWRGTPRPVVFLHVPKTAGTSVIDMLLRLRPWSHAWTSDGNITPELVARCAALPPEERRRCLIYGHAFHGTLGGLADALLLTVLRDPEAHAVSNYLHVQRDPANSLHGDAQALGFGPFLRRHWQWLVFQSISLAVPASARPLASAEELFSVLPAVRAVLRRVDVLGAAEDLPAFAAALGRRLGLPPPEIGHLNRASDFGVPPERVLELRAEYRALAAEPEAARLMAVEQDVYQAARRARSLLATPGRLTRPGRRSGSG